MKSGAHDYQRRLVEQGHEHVRERRRRLAL